ncbi:SDR family oxidoreductase [Jannaschia seohaensis]|uniref:3-oxoacyl-[acyl-carrier protein] reductase n=1 Tax=Jannaschia seohaensis TaxID=475081 RepID=A0A2Y9C2U7_9RHOB|nr:SDR family oxidoreductase [Jannaschia seohaensis]PWJ13819.1 3-oxoacyl-[acyl-carrier protein] reductase [Jannaschia seohaensis]SSA50332.1 3-oxoacyl-[acyl-carrier protein] reductase [Jannaschia seohaensis]
MRLNGKSALVTGGGAGFGAEIARVFAREGARVTILDLNGDAAQATASDIGDAAQAVVGDVTSAADIARALEAAQDFGGRLDIVVNNAGWTHRNKPMLEVTEDEFDRVYAINVKSIFHMSGAAVPVMREQGGGVIINVGSTAGIRPRPGLTWYNSTKGAVNLLSRSMAVELAPDGIRVNCVAPVIGATGLLESFMGVPDTPENRAKFIATVPLGRLSEPGDVASACLYLASDEAGFITGVVLEVDGGRTV